MRLTRRLLVAAFTLSSTLLLGGCSSEEFRGVGFSGNVSSVNQHSFTLWQGAWIAAAVVGVFTMILIIWPAIFHRKKNDKFPKQFQYNIPIEIAYTVIPFLIIAVLFGYTARAQNEIKEVSPITATDVHDVTVNAIQWSWQFTYKEAGPGTTVTGTPAQPPTLYMPQGEKVRFKITASDVVHGFWIPAFMMQIQNIPGVRIKSSSRQTSSVLTQGVATFSAEGNTPKCYSP